MENIKNNEEFDFTFTVEEEKEFNPVLKYYKQKYVNQLKGTLEDDFDFVMEIPTFPVDRNYTVGFEEKNNVVEPTVPQKKKLHDKYEKLIKAISISLGVTIASAGMYLFIKSAQATNMVDEAHGARMVDNAGTVIYKNGEPTKEEYEKAFRELLHDDLEAVKEFFVNVGDIFTPSH